MSDLPRLLERALEARRELRERLEAEGTDAWRLFHGISEGRPGLAVDRYGPLLLACSFREDLAAGDLEALERLAAHLGLELAVWRRGALGASPPPEPGFHLCHEQGQAFRIADRPRGLDPYLFLDFRAGRRWLRREVPATAEVLNVFAYTCSAGVAAAARGAEVWNVDFGRWCLEVGRENGVLNGLDPERFHLWREDAFPILWQLAGTGVRGRGARRPYMRVPPRSFDVLILDPPTRATSAFGKVDLVADYPAMLKPCLLATRPGGRVLATNHAPELDREAWGRILVRTGEKAGRPLRIAEFLEPEEDFPSLDGAPPLKIAVLEVD